MLTVTDDTFAPKSQYNQRHQVLQKVANHIPKSLISHFPLFDFSLVDGLLTINQTSRTGQRQEDQYIAQAWR